MENTVLSSSAVELMNTSIMNFEFRSVTGGKISYPTTMVTQRPPNGWNATVKIKGVPINVSASTPEYAIERLVGVARANGMTVTPQEAWLVLNHAWVNASDPKRSKVSSDDITEALNLSATGFESQSKNWVPQYTPADWGSIAWKWLGLLLTTETYNKVEFEGALKTLLSLMNPDENPLTGCDECYGHCSTAFAWFIEEMKVEDIQAAREWLFSFHNLVNKRLKKKQLTFTKAAEINHWGS